MADVHDKATRSYNMSMIKGNPDYYRDKLEMISRKFLFAYDSCKNYRIIICPESMILQLRYSDMIKIKYFTLRILIILAHFMHFRHLYMTNIYNKTYQNNTY